MERQIQKETNWVRVFCEQHTAVPWWTVKKINRLLIRKPYNFHGKALLELLMNNFCLSRGDATVLLPRFLSRQHGMVGEFRKTRVTSEKCYVWKWHIMDLVGSMVYFPGGWEEVQQLHGQSGGLESVSLNGSFVELSHSENMCRCTYKSFPWEVPLLSWIRGIPCSRWCSVSLSQFCSSPNCLLLPPTLAHSPELPCQSLLSSLAVLFDCLFLSIAQSILPFLKDRKEYVHWMLYHVVDVCHWCNIAWIFW